ncbi:hypothetical protein PHAVU_010G009300 [Phaseolus vulgaris]|uniref:Transmembrane protein n=1 Tax=Phaseolus vulgaris TaxID=3885 RepID=V7AKA0_PHAVU|nr:hypothetical protein PHAVU_010G009300g [Phaseolus vulgaris]ESW05979.1 hypothetical protein PHAVU_010G009300g [Phaseolus vulgaris]
MAKFLFLCFLLANTLLNLTNATNQPQIMFQSTSTSSSKSPSESPCGQRSNTSEPSIGRKLGKHQHNEIRSSDTKSPTPSEAPKSENSSSEGGIIPSHERTSVEGEDGTVLGSHHGEMHLTKQQHHHSFDKSIAGAGVILGGLATTFLVSVFCYIKATGRNKLETTA